MDRDRLGVVTVPAWLHSEIGGHPPWRWALAALVAAAVLTAILLVRRVGMKRLAAITARTRSPYDDVLVDVVGRTSPLVILVAALAVGARTLDLTPRNEARVDHVLVVACALQVGLWATRAIRLVLEVRRKREDLPPGTRTLGAAAGFAANIVVWCVLSLLVLSNLGVEVSSLVAGLGIGGVAAALAVQNVLGDLFAAFSLYLDRPFDLGDFVVVDSFMGTVEKISWRSTQLRSLGGELVVLSNGDLARARIRNYKRMQERRVVVELGVEYGTPAAKLERIPSMVKESIERIEGLRFDRAHFARYGASSLDFEVVFYVLSADYNQFMDRQQSLLFDLYRRFEDEGISFAFPTQTLHVRAAVTGAEPLPTANRPS